MMKVNKWKVKKIINFLLQFVIPVVALRFTDLLGSSFFVNHHIRPTLLRFVGFKIGHYCIIGPRISIHLDDNTIGTHEKSQDGYIDVLSSFQLGDYCKIDPDVLFINRRQDKITELNPFCPLVALQPIIIEDYVWISSNVTISNCHFIGRGSVLAYGATVDRNIPPDTKVDGIRIKVPYRIYTKNGQPSIRRHRKHRLSSK